jgi:heme/copper-type cytochrome/quinol oxidase subunit 2
VVTQYAAVSSLPQAGTVNSGVIFFWIVIAAVAVVAAIGVIIIVKGRRHEKK